MTATGESDTRNTCDTCDMIAARQELELRPALERLDRIVAASEGIDPGALTFAFRPLWQIDAATAATVALQRAQATQIYAGLDLWPAAATARLVEAQLAADGTYPNAAAVFGKGGAFAAQVSTVSDYNPDQLRDPDGRWSLGGSSTAPRTVGVAPIDPVNLAVAKAASTIGPASTTGGAGGSSPLTTQLIPPDIFFEDPPVVPDPGIPYPSDPTLPPSPDYVWKGPPGSRPGDPKGSWYNEKTGESFHTDLDHKPGVDPHYDYQVRGSKGKGWR